MSTATTRIVRIGNSRGFRVPKVLLDQADLPDEVELRAEPGRLVVTAARAARAGWEHAAQQMHSHVGDELLDPGQTTSFDEQEWTW
jgi:antitoxin MazE